MLCTIKYDYRGGVDNNWVMGSVDLKNETNRPKNIIIVTDNKKKEMYEIVLAITHDTYKVLFPLSSLQIIKCVHVHENVCKAKD